jgi:amidase/6-aminohexanoate-cyclic-dimer hydrolase
MTGEWATVAFTDYEKYDALGLAELIRRREVSAEEVLDAALARVDERNPAINAVIRPMADEARAQIRAGLPDGPLSGVPWLVKDLFVLVKGVPTTQGSRLFAEAVADHDSTITARWRKAGLVIFGKTNTPEFGGAMTTEPALFGPTRNPWNPAHSPGGSSGGSGAAVAARMVPVAHATDSGGSIRIPAANNGLFGLKPSRARNPQGPDIGEGLAGLSTGHAVTLTVRDSAAILDATHGPAPGDPYACPPPARPYSQEVGADPGRLRIGVTTVGPIGQKVDAEVADAVLDVAKLCESLGHHVEEAAPKGDFGPATAGLRVLIAGNLRGMIDARLRLDLKRAQRPGDVEPVTAAWAEEGRRYTSAEYAGAVMAMHRLGRAYGAFFESYDILLSPTLAKPPLKLGELDMRGTDVGAYVDQLVAEAPFTIPFNQSGCPAMSMPLAWSKAGLPIGIHFGAAYGREDTLFRLAAQLEQARPWRDKRPG